MLSEKSRENKLRRRLRNEYGYLLRKSRKLMSLDNLGEYMIVDACTNGVIRGARFDWSLDDIEQFLDK